MKKFLSLTLLVFMLISCTAAFSGCFSISTDSETGDSKTVANVGESLVIDTLTVTLNSVNEYVDNSGWDDAEEGKIFVILNFTVKNNGTSDDSFSSFNEGSYCDDVAIDTAFLWNYDGDEIWGSVNAGRSKIGYVAYEAPKNWQKIELIYQELFGDEFTFVATKADLNKAPTETNKDTNTDTTTDTNTNTNTQTSGIKVGETGYLGSLKFTFERVEEYIDTEDWALDIPAAGKTFILLHFTVKNEGSTNDYINSFYEDSYCDDFAIDPVSILFDYDGDTIWGDVASGRMRTGYIAYEVDTDWEKIEFVYETFSNDITFVAYRSDLN